MSLNTNSHFSLAPHANIPRSRFDMSHTVKMTANGGVLNVADVMEVLPGDTFSVDTALLARMQTLIVPLMDDLFVDVYWFYVPSRLLWKHWQQFCGEDDTPWFDDTVYTVPQISVNVKSQTGTSAVKVGTLADQLGFPLAPENGSGTYTRKYNHLPFRGYVKIWNDWFRNENTQDLAAFNTEDNDVTMNNAGDAFYGGSLLPVNKYRDYFTSALPGPERGNPVSIGLTGKLPVNTNGNIGYEHPWQSIYIQGHPVDPNISMDPGKHYVMNVEASNSGTNGFVSANLSPGSQTYGRFGQDRWNVDLSDATAITINELRYAFATQRYLEQLARSGSRYIEFLEGIFGVSAPDARLQRSEFLGGNRLRVSINSVTQQSETGETPLGNLGAYSLTTDNQNSFTKSFVEHGYLYCVYAIRYKNSYQDGIPTIFQRKDFEDYYNPYFANIGEQPIINQTLYVDGSDADLEVFGYQEAWADYRYGFNQIKGEMRSRYSGTLDYWHLADDYTSRPYLDDEWSKSDGEVIDRTLAVSSRVADQFLLDFYFDIKATRPMPMYSVPGLDIL